MSYDHWRHYARGWLFHFIGKPEAAYEAYVAAFRIDPQDVQSARHLAAIAAQRKNFQVAEHWFLEVLRIVPEDADSHFNLGFVREQMKALRPAIESFKEAVRLKPTQDRAWYGMGLAYAALGEHAAAAELAYAALGEHAAAAELAYAAPNVDCLVCHDTTGGYRKDPNRGGFPDPSADLVAISKKVGRPSRQTCGSCHFYSGGGPNAKHGDMEPALAELNNPIDMHMGTLNMRCQDCHTTREHRIADMSLTAPAVEGRVSCDKCHGLKPHGLSGSLSRLLDDHVRHVACETCHIPAFARRSPTLLRRDYSTAGRDRPESLDRYGMPTYDKKFGALTWGKDLVPRSVKTARCRSIARNWRTSSKHAWLNYFR